MKPRIIVCGLGRTGYQIFCLLKQQGACVIGIHDCPLPDQSDQIIVGNPQAAATLRAAGIQEAHTLVLAGADDALNLTILMQAKVLNPRIRIINRLFNDSLGDRLDQTLPHHTTMSVSALAAPVFAFAALGNLAIGQLSLFNQTWPIHEEYIDLSHPWQGRKLSDLWDERARMLIYYLPAHKQMDLVSGVLCGQTLQIGDRLIVATQPKARSTRQSLLRHLRQIATGLRRFQQHSRSMVTLILTLLATILIATLTYLVTDLNTSFPDALYFSVGMITGAGGKEVVAENAPDSIKVFTVVMMLVGAGVIGICYALLNDFILGTRFKQFWDVARVPQRHHYIISGLGGIGIQIAHQLRLHKHEVVIIERDPTNRFLNTARSLGIPLIQGDASIPASLQAANIQQAAALLAVTSDDTTNLEIALSAKGLAPKLPVIVRNQDPHFARMAQQVFDFEAVLSPAELAAPAFAAAALGGRILGNGITANILWVALAAIITPGHPFCGKRIQEAAMDADFVPLYVETNCQMIHGWNLLEVYLSAGDILYLTIPATKLDQLWRVAPLIGVGQAGSLN